MTDRFSSLEPSTRILLDAVVAMSSDLDLRGVLTRIVRSASKLAGAAYGELAVLGDDGTTVVDVVTSGTEPSGPNRLALPVRIRGTVFGNLHLTRPEGDDPFSDQQVALVEALATAAGYVIENARAFTVSERRRRWLEAAAELTETLQPPIDHVDALHRVCRSARALTGACAVSVGTHDEHGPAAAVAADGDLRDRIVAATEELGRRVPYRVEDVMEERIDGLIAIIAPMRAQLAGRGALVAFYDQPLRAFQLEERELLASFAEQAALALDRARAIEDRADLAVVSDRERIARDLHDIVIQRLFATGLQLQALTAQASDPDRQQRLADAVDALDQTVKDIRLTIFELQHRGGRSLRVELRDLIREYVGVLGYPPVIHTSGPVDTGVPDDVRDHLLSVLREAISNVARHAQASTVDIDLSVGPDELVLKVDDDGVGVGDDSVESGLRNARRRAIDLRGSFELRAREPHGTSFVWRVPIG